jgi:hypothetical protein
MKQNIKGSPISASVRGESSLETTPLKPYKESESTVINLNESFEDSDRFNPMKNDNL